MHKSLIFCWILNLFSKRSDQQRRAMHRWRAAIYTWTCKRWLWQETEHHLRWYARTRPDDYTH